MELNFYGGRHSIIKKPRPALKKIENCSVFWYNPSECFS